MQTTSELWNTLYSDISTKTNVKVVIAGVEYTPATLGLVQVTNGMFDDDFSIGNCFSAELTVKVRNGNDIPAMSKVELYIQLRNGTQESEWIRKGIYFIDTREVGKIWTTLTCYDRMLMTENPFPTQSGDTWPMPMNAFVSRVCSKIGCTLDSRSSISSTYKVDKPTGITMRTALGYIAACHAGNFVMTDDGKLRLIKHGQGDTVTMTSAMGYDAGYTYEPIQYVRMTTDDDDEYLAGTDPESDSVFGVEMQNPYATSAITTAVYNALTGYVYHPYSASGMRVNPATEIGDKFTYNDTTHYIYYARMNLYPSYKGDIKAPGQGEINHEYLYEGAEALAESRQRQSYNYNSSSGGLGGAAYVRLNRNYGGFKITTARARIGTKTEIGVFGASGDVYPAIRSKGVLTTDLRLRPSADTSVRNIVVVTEADWNAGNVNASLGDVIAVIEETITTLPSSGNTDPDPTDPTPVEGEK